MKLTYSLIKPIITKEEINGNLIHLEFCAKNQERPIPTIAVIKSEPNKIKKTIEKKANTGAVKDSILNQVMNLMGVKDLSKNIIEIETKDLINKNQSYKDIIATEISPESKEKTIVNAFKGFISKYIYNEQSLEWEYKSFLV